MIKKSTKGSLAAGAAAVLLLGGAGSLAYWNSTQDVAGGDIVTGDMSITAPTCTDWTLDSAEETAGDTFDPTSDTLVPGDVITETCTTTFNGTGNHLRATLDAEAGTNDGLFTSGELSLDVGSLESSSDGTTWTTVPATGLTEDNDGDSVELEVTVSFDGSADNDTEDVTSALGDIVITATQVHS
ncbi:MAG: alternate-type signal peptide domain-containing protein [Nocardioides sp.]|uniref:alternate-type signal peptide domain-containing protein n=1 Tax=Nocardioides sp. TaxID=35761 RepID=UPI0039E266A1